MSDAVDAAISQLDFEALMGRKIFLDTAYLNQVNGVGFVNAGYIISSLRQKMTASGCLLQDAKSDAEVIVEARAGTLGTDGHEVTYGIPPSSSINTAASIVAKNSGIPILPELSIGRSDSQKGVAKVALFAYEKDTRQAVWQSGIARAESSSKNTWIFGAGPIQRGTIHNGVKFAGSQVIKREPDHNEVGAVSYFANHDFSNGEVLSGERIRTAQNPTINQDAAAVDEKDPDE